MADTLTITITNANDIARRATTVYERAAALASGTAEPSDEVTRNDAAHVLATWTAAFSPGNTAAWRRRLRWDGLDETSALRIVAAAPQEPVDEQLTQWLDRIARQCPPALAQLREEGVDQQSKIPFNELWAPMVLAARLELCRQCPEHVRQVFGPDAASACEKQLRRDLAAVATPTFHEAFRRRQARPHYRPFVEDTLADRFASIFAAWPVAARHLTVILASWVAAMEELLSRLHADRDVIAATFGRGAPLGAVCAIAPALSDPHHGRRRVAILEFEAGVRVVYKPRDVAIEAAYNGLLGWLSSCGLSPAPPALKVLARHRYGWVAYAARAASHDRARLHTYYHQAGVLLCLAHLLRGRDLHMDNLVATADGPVLVDVECLFQSVPAATARLVRSLNRDSTVLDEGVLGTGLLSLIDVTADGVPHDLGGLRGTPDTRTAPVKQWIGVGTDDLQVIAGYPAARRATNEVTCDGARAVPDDFADDILDGFSEAYDLIRGNREAMLAAGGPLARFAGTFSRVLPRPTNQYALLVTALTAPAYQRDGARWSCALDALHRPLASSMEKPAVWPIVVAERSALQRLDFPHFSVCCDGTTIFDGEQPVLDDHFSQSGMSAVVERLDQMSDADRSAQYHQLRDALGESTTSRFTSTWSPRGREAGETPEIFMEAALWIAAELRARIASHTRPAAHDRYGGDLGPALFWAALAKTTDDGDWRELARRSASRLVDAAHFDGHQDGAPLGAGSGLGSTVYGLTSLGVLLDDGQLLDAAERAAAAISGDRIWACSSLDVEGGVAGAALALLALHRARPRSRALDRAVACARLLVARQEDVSAGIAWRWCRNAMPLGYAHGVAGIACALGRVARETGESTFAQSAGRAWSFIDRQFLPEACNWPVSANATPDACGTTRSMMAWCHGAPGIVLGRLDRLVGMPDTTPEIASALSAIARWPVGPVDSLCCGNLGRAEVLLEAGTQLGDAPLMGAARNLAMRVVTRAAARRHFGLSSSGFEYRIFTPGFFQGLSGIGYALLRLSSPSVLPSVLSFESVPPPARVAAHTGGGSWR